MIYIWADSWWFIPTVGDLFLPTVIYPDSRWFILTVSSDSRYHSMETPVAPTTVGTKVPTVGTKVPTVGTKVPTVAIDLT